MSDEQYWMGGDESTVWCHDGHEPKLVGSLGEDAGVCPVCGNRFEITVEVEVLERTDD